MAVLYFLCEIITRSSFCIYGVIAEIMTQSAVADRALECSLWRPVFSLPSPSTPDLSDVCRSATTIFCSDAFANMNYFTSIIVSRDENAESCVSCAEVLFSAEVACHCEDWRVGGIFSTSPITQGCSPLMGLLKAKQKPQS